MPQQRSLIVLGFAILLGLVAVYLANVYLGGVEKRQEVVQQGNMKVVVARVPLEFGTEITPDKVRLIDMPIAAAPAGTFASIDAMLPMNKRRVALRPIAINEPILTSKISGEGGRASISAVLRPDMRAASVSILKNLGYSVVEAGDAHEAVLAMDGGRPFDLVFSDIVMPGDLTGIDLARIARGRGVQVLLTSGFANPVEIHAEARTQGIEVLAKPYRKADLAARIRALLGPEPSGGA